ncbi:Uncharacterised protein [Mycobacteroides abscessus subsp. bolletii]|uniref:Holliday junction nuclease RuvC n=1 Tax=Mycobacteroides abscessus subsp. bolletii TaxID=319705 RepID=A0A9Q7SEM0_9MYCO|nr:hypothetical protein [Mycobacteroides abscessus]SHT85380.1 Uncharacterised protein [Mycobacteroides abscessus subsp. bolletii]SHU02408.1 Uncharacterised protein [Mycobacteroides abscessus subsp. bolletii]SHX42893.1 Uncharacterised protein [Mycobacteroides abscessus subsp. bolletii]SKM64878.1 Uncharacterised protein [Mycobacteroides abscessus subsp. bolletii]SKN39032.1 Uncharacterised protein [Mycobacteroides abscessus subsp. bolletii]
MAIAVGIDPSLTSTGVAVLVDGRPAHYGRYGRDGHNGATYHSRNNRIRQLRTDVWKAGNVAGRPDVVVLEEHPYMLSSPGTFDRSGLWHLIFEAFDARGIPIVVVGNTVGKSWVTGAGHASKLDVIDVIDEWFDLLPKPLSSWRKKDNPDDVADAFGYATMGAYKLGDPIPFEPKERHRTALQTLPWPTIARAR